jgi:DNA uptake protein ComE-like DNA-binding protein
MPISIAADAEQFRQRSNLMNLPTAKARGTDVATTGGAGSSKSTSTSTSTWKPGGTRPTAPTVPEFKAPEYNEGEVAKLRQRVGGAQVRSLRDVTMSALSANTSDNPNVRKMTVRQALQGYGSGLGSILASAQQAAVNQYQNKYNQQFNAAQMTYNSQRSMDAQTYSNLWSEFLRSGTQTQTQNSSSQTVNANGSTGGQGVSSVPSAAKPAGPDPWSAPKDMTPVVDVRNRSGNNWDPFPNLKT